VRQEDVDNAPPVVPLPPSTTVVSVENVGMAPVPHAQNTAADVVEQADDDEVGWSCDDKL
jgi:hypothetical protein